jgi:hypothetical protein
MDWRNKTTDRQQLGVTVTKGRRSNFDGIWPPGSKPAGKPASKPADPSIYSPVGNIGDTWCLEE